MEAATPANSAGLLDVLRERQAQARAYGDTYLAAVADADSMLFWLARAVSAAREAGGRRQVHVAASASVDQSTIARFEKGGSWPRNPETVVAAYADDLSVNPIDLWEEAVREWRAFKKSGGAASDPQTILDQLNRVREDAQQQAGRSAPSTATDPPSPAESDSPGEPEAPAPETPSSG